MLKISPYIFPFSYLYKGYSITLQDSNEAICQGGPVVSSLSIDNSRVGQDSMFGGPILFYQNLVIVPKLTHEFYKGQGFVLTAIDLDTLEQKTISKFKPMILLSEIRANEVFFFTDLENSAIEKVKLREESL